MLPLHHNVCSVFAQKFQNAECVTGEALLSAEVLLALVDLEVTPSP
jgi:hypothetical protein